MKEAFVALVVIFACAPTLRAQSGQAQAPAKQAPNSFGNPRSEQMHLTERYRRVDKNTLEMQIIMDDPKAYQGVWTNAPRLFKLEPGWELGEFFCVLDEEDDYASRVRKPAGGAAVAPNP